MNIPILLFLSTIFAFIGGTRQDQDVVRTSSGLVKGVSSISNFSKVPFLAFRGIPYAEAPVGRLRFHPPQPVLPWPGIRDCFQHGPMCIQGNATGSEDCLTLNVYTQNVTGESAVMVFIFGGAFYSGSADSSLYGPDILIEQGVVLVTLNYRLGMLGNLALDDPIISGNQGLKDQQLALRWIQQNAKAFGGDPSRITLFGQSAGAFSVQLHMLAPGSRNLFQRAIMMSTAFDARSTFRPIKPQILPNIIAFFQQRNQSVDNLPELIHQLMQIPAADLVRGFPFVRFEPLPMPIVESQNARYPFIQGSPDYFAFEGNFNLTIDVLAGYTSNEAIAISSLTSFQSFLADFEVDIPTIHFDLDYNSLNYQAAAERIANRYFPSGLTNASIGEYVQLMSHIYQNYPGDRFVHHLAQHSSGKTFHYVFDLDTSMSAVKRSLLPSNEVAGLYGAAHADDLCYIFYCAGTYPEMYKDVVPGTKAYSLMRSMSDIYGRFAKTGEASWGQVVNGNAVSHLYMGMEEFVAKRDTFREGRIFWDEIAFMFD